jgi:IclR family pca regulon transcriptional regulator
MEERKIVKSLLKGLSVFEAFTPEEFNLSLKELTFKTRLPKATAARFLRTLVTYDYLSFDSKSKKYFLGPRATLLGFKVFSNLELRSVAYPYLKELSDLCGQNVNLGILDKTEIIYIESIKKKHTLGVNLYVGSSLNSYQSSIGRAILAFLGQKEFQAVLGNLLKDREAVRYIGEDGKKLIELLNGVRNMGYATSDQEFIKGIRSIAAPIFSAQGYPEGAANIPVFSHMVSQEELINQFVPLLLNTTGKISAVRGFING